MEDASGGSGSLNNSSSGREATPKARMAQSLRHSLPSIGTRGSESISDAPPKLLRVKTNGGDGGNGNCGNRETVAGAPHISRGAEGGAESGGRSRSREGGKGGSDRVSGGGGTSVSAADAAVAAAAAALTADALAAIEIDPSAVRTPDAATPQNSDWRPSPERQAEEHLSCKYTKEELLGKHWGMNVMQMKRVKALLRMGVSEEDLQIADRLLKMGRNVSDDTPLTKEEQLLGYSSEQRQRMKALQILGLTEESFERCRAVMLSSLGPSAFGYTADETAKSAVRAEAEEGWTPGDKFRRKGNGPHFGGEGGGGLHSNLLKIPVFGNHNRNHAHIGNLGGSAPTRRMITNGHQASPLGPSGRFLSGRTGVSPHTRRASDSDKGGYLPGVNKGKSMVRNGAVAIAMPTPETKSPPGPSSPLSSSSNPR